MPPLVDSYSDGGQASSSAIAPELQCKQRPKPELPQPSFAPPSLKRCAPMPPQMIGTITPKSPLYTCPIKHLSLRLASSLSTAYVSRKDPSTSFYLYLPSSHPVSRRWRGDVPPPQEEGGKGEWDGYGEFKVVVLVHGSVRDAERLRNSWAERAEKEGVVIVAPLWPGTLDFPDGSNAYKYIIHPSIFGGERKRYDLILFDILEQLKEDWGFMDIDRFGLAGFSGGGQFVHRLLYLWPERISAVSIGAPGGSTLISPLPWPRGTANTKTLFGITVDPTRINDTAVQIIVGSEDHYHPVKDDGTEYHLSRYEIAVELHDNFTKHGVEHEWAVVEGGWHETDLFRPQVQDFIFRHLGLSRSNTGKALGG